MEIIVSAKDRQAAEANKNASILLEELDLEKSREESKKLAAARKREKKRRKKKEKQEKEKEKEREEHKDEPRLVQQFILSCDTCIPLITLCKKHFVILVKIITAKLS